MIHAQQPKSSSIPRHIDQRVCLHGVDWNAFEAVLAARGEESGTRITYLDGELELMTPSIDHESLKTRLARLLETWAEIMGLELEGFGSWTLKGKAQRLGVEADECYVVGPCDGPPSLPDLVIEVVWTSGGLDKLEAYRRLGVPEVWFWQDGRLRFFLLQGDRYLSATRSRVLSDLDPGQFNRCMAEPTQTSALRALRQAVGGGER